MAVCFQNLTLGALSSRSALSMLAGALLKKVGLFFEYSSTNKFTVFILKCLNNVWNPTKQKHSYVCFMCILLFFYYLMSVSCLEMADR
jgi:hypothetical protein